MLKDDFWIIQNEILMLKISFEEKLKIKISFYMSKNVISAIIMAKSYLIKKYAHKTSCKTMWKVVL